jgi:hypothetical protein
MAELQATEEHLRGEIRGHFERAVNFQKMMENAATLAGDELEKIGGLNQELEKVRIRAEAEYANLREQLSGYAGIIGQLPAPARMAESEFDWTEEIDKLRKVRDLLATLRQAELSGDANDSPADSSAEAEASVPAAEAVEELAASLGLIDSENNGAHAGAEFSESDHTETSAAPTGETREEDDVLPAEPPVDAAAILESLTRYRRTEPVNNGIELAFFAGESATVLDADSFMSAIGKIVDGARLLHSQLDQTTSVKDLFLLKQEILNQQEVLRKVFFRIIRFCEKEGGRLPQALDEIMGVQGMKEIIERLTMANWSDPSDFKPFLNELNSLRRSFAAHTAASPNYLRTVLDGVEAREN